MCGTAEGLQTRTGPLNDLRSPLEGLVSPVWNKPSVCQGISALTGHQGQVTSRFLALITQRCVKCVDYGRLGSKYAAT